MKIYTCISHGGKACTSSLTCLDVGINVHLDNAVLEGKLNLVLLRARTAVEHEVDGLVVLALLLF
jgi:hypothetical protein